MAGARKVRCTVRTLTAHGGRAYTAVLRPHSPAPRFRAGQFLHLALDPYAPTEFWPESRAFSIASSPADRSDLRITYSVQGRFTARMESEISEGRDVWIKMPYGNFVIEDGRDVVLFAGGTGITAFTAFLSSLADSSGSHVTVAYGARTTELLIYRDLVQQTAASGSRFAMYFIEHRNGAAAGADSVRAGRLSVDAIWPHIPQPRGAGYYISGPPAMLTQVAGALRARGIAEEAIHIDAWE